MIFREEYGERQLLYGRRISKTCLTPLYHIPNPVHKGNHRAFITGNDIGHQKIKKIANANKKLIFKNMVCSLSIAAIIHLMAIFLSVTHRGCFSVGLGSNTLGLKTNKMGLATIRLIYDGNGVIIRSGIDWYPNLRKTPSIKARNYNYTPPGKNLIETTILNLDKSFFFPMSRIHAWLNIYSDLLVC